MRYSIHPEKDGLYSIINLDQTMEGQKYLKYRAANAMVVVLTPIIKKKKWVPYYLS